MIGVGAAQGRGHGSANNPGIDEFGADAADHFLHAGFDRFD